MPLSSQWGDVQCALCRKRLAEADHPSDRYAVGGFRSVEYGHARFWSASNDGVVFLCKAPRWKPKSPE
jgi:hypothetical protein